MSYTRRPYPNKDDDTLDFPSQRRPPRNRRSRSRCRSPSQVKKAKNQSPSVDPGLEGCKSQAPNKPPKPSTQPERSAANPPPSETQSDRATSRETSNVIVVTTSADASRTPQEETVLHITPTLSPIPIPPAPPPPSSEHNSPTPSATLPFSATATITLSPRLHCSPRPSPLDAHAHKRIWYFECASSILTLSLSLATLCFMLYGRGIDMGSSFEAAAFVLVAGAGLSRVVGRCIWERPGEQAQQQQQHSGGGDVVELRDV